MDTDKSVFKIPLLMKQEEALKEALVVDAISVKPVEVLVEKPVIEQRPVVADNIDNIYAELTAISEEILQCRLVKLENC
jgi:hypothetical protein